MVRFEMVDGMSESLVEGHLGQPVLLTEVAVRRQYILMSDPVGGVESGNDSIAVRGASHQQDNERNYLTLDGGEGHGDEAVFIEPDDKKFVRHSRIGFTLGPKSHRDEPRAKN